jgi:beta-lactamase superfamily II metal-dependent hydrolase
MQPSNHYNQTTMENETAPNETALKVYVFNIGSGDHIMLEFPDGSLGIIDSFYQSSHLELKEAPALAFLRKRLEDKQLRGDSSPLIINFLCISHADTDHLKGLEGLLSLIREAKKRIRLENLWLFGSDIENYIHTTVEVLNEPLGKLKDKAWDEYSARVDGYKERLAVLRDFVADWRHEMDQEVQYFNAIKKVETYNFPSGFRARSLGPTASQAARNSNESFKNVIRCLLMRLNELKNKADIDKAIDFSDVKQVDRNGVSCILGLKYDNYNLIFGGDATRNMWETSLADIHKLNHKNWLFPDFLKASHHGAEGSSSPAMWELMFPPESDKKDNLFVGISAGTRYRHPHDEFYREIEDCCKNKKINLHVKRTNECQKCLAFKFAGVAQHELAWFHHPRKDKPARRPVVKQLLDDERPRKGQKDGPVPVQETCSNLLAYVFEFPESGNNQDIRIWKGVSGQIGSYSSCVLKNKSTCYCNPPVGP